jgi:hypothetical protein
MKKQLCLILAVVVSVSAQAEAYYRIVQGRIIPKNDRNWTVFRDKIKVVDFAGGAIKCAIYVTEDVHGTTMQKDNRGRAYVGATEHTEYKLKEYIILTNYPGGLGLARGSDINPPIMAMRIGSIPVDGAVAVEAATAGAQVGPVGGGPASVRVSRRPGVSSGSATHSVGPEIAVYDYGVDFSPPAPVRKASPQNPGVTNQPAGTSNPGAPKLTPEEATKLRFYQERAAQGKDLYQYFLGKFYLTNSVEKDLAKAREWLKKSADQGNADAAAELEKIPASEPPAESNPAPAGGTH